MQNINYRLLAVLATVSWIGLCVFSAATWSHQFQSFRTTLATRSAAHRPTGEHDAQPEAGNGWSTCIWLVALSANACIYLAFNFIKRALVSIRWKLEQLISANNASGRVNTETAKSLQHIDQHLHGVRQSQASLLALVHNILATSATATSRQPELTAMQLSNIDRSLFYLQHIAEYFRVRTGDASRAIDDPATVLAEPGRRHAIRRSPRSELILKRISRQLIQPIRMRYNAMCMRRARLEQMSAHKPDRTHRSLTVRRTQSCMTGGGLPKHPAAGDHQLLRSDSKREEAHAPQSRLLEISYRTLSKRRAQQAVPE